jgi:hypothetical protein
VSAKEEAPVNKSAPPPETKTVSLVFVAVFQAGTQTRMSCHGSPDKPDLKRGIKLAHAAWQSRHRTDNEPPTIAKAHFEGFNGEVLKEYAADELSKGVQP